MIDFSMETLVVDDVATIRKIVKHALKEIGFKHIKEAVDGKEALSLLRNEEIGLILCDWNMPNMNGLELLKEPKLSGSVFEQQKALLARGKNRIDLIIERKNHL